MITLSSTFHTCPIVIAGLVHFALEEFLAHYGIDNKHEDNKYSNME